MAAIAVCPEAGRVVCRRSCMYQLFCTAAWDMSTVKWAKSQMALIALRNLEHSSTREP